MNTGTQAIQSKHGLLTTVCYQLGQERAVYALEGAVAVAGEGVRWLRDGLGIIRKSSEVGTPHRLFGCLAAGRLTRQV